MYAAVCGAVIYAVETLRWNVRVSYTLDQGLGERGPLLGSQDHGG